MIEDKKEFLKSIKKSNWIDKVDVYMLGLSAPLEREIMRYIYNQHKVVDLHLLQINFVYRGEYCSILTLNRRLQSLVDYGFLSRSEVHHTIFYSIIDEACKIEI